MNIASNVATISFRWTAKGNKLTKNKKSGHKDRFP